MFQQLRRNKTLTFLNFRRTSACFQKKRLRDAQLLATSTSLTAQRGPQVATPAVPGKGGEFQPVAGLEPRAGHAAMLHPLQGLPGTVL